MSEWVSAFYFILRYLGSFLKDPRSTYRKHRGWDTMNKAIPRALRWSWCCPPYAIICSEIEKVTSVQFLFLCCERQTISNCVIKQWVKKLSVKINWTVHIFLLKKSHPSPRRPKQRYVHWFTEFHCFWNIFMLLPVWTDLLLVVFHTHVTYIKKKATLVTFLQYD